MTPYYVRLLTNLLPAASSASARFSCPKVFNIPGTMQAGAANAQLETYSTVGVDAPRSLWSIAAPKYDWCAPNGFPFIPPGVPSVTPVQISGTYANGWRANSLSEYAIALDAPQLGITESITFDAVARAFTLGPCSKLDLGECFVVELRIKRTDFKFNGARYYINNLKN
ncbi:hypothetical protein MKEN_01138100 [Mycena kentingensis (nom. inval.)]|nr:hypothetical protein MKEN_01138100 [Mycena kentingensis (nom. inval.)]